MTRATIDETIVTFSAHVEEHYPSPEEFRRNVDALLEDKAGRAGEEEYLASLERNVVFLHDVVVEGEALLDELLEGRREGPPVEERLVALETRARARTTGRLAILRGEAADDEFAELRAARREGGAAWRERLEFEYRHLMALRIFLFEFLNVLAAVLDRYELADAGEGGAGRVMTHLEMTAHLYLGNVTVEEGEKAPPESGDADNA